MLSSSNHNGSSSASGIRSGARSPARHTPGDRRQGRRGVGRSRAAGVDVVDGVDALRSAVFRRPPVSARPWSGPARRRAAPRNTSTARPAGSPAPGCCIPRSRLHRRRRHSPVQPFGQDFEVALGPLRNRHEWYTGRLDGARRTPGRPGRLGPGRPPGPGGRPRTWVRRKRSTLAPRSKPPGAQQTGPGTPSAHSARAASTPAPRSTPPVHGPRPIRRVPGATRGPRRRHAGPEGRRARGFEPYALAVLDDDERDPRLEAARASGAAGHEAPRQVGRRQLDETEEVGSKSAARRGAPCAGSRWP